ncbi:flagellar filament capping protein FliD [Pseudoduganella sp. OTU4001]|uniref:flagellar filament capping protein FliD n=1 Tax=Pseudoduganella sp. OTU4001 TaxID=3043854 RepID=UPI00313EA17D
MAISSPTLTSPGIGSGLNVNDIVAKLMAAEAAPLQAYERKAASYQAKVSALGSLSGAIGVFQSALGSLTKADAFRALSAVAGDDKVLTATAGAKATPGNYNINVTQLAQAQTLTSSGLASKNTAIGLGTKTTMYFEFGTATNVGFGVDGSGITSAMHTNGLADGSLTINGTAISTTADTKSAAALATAINAKTATTGVSASTMNIFSTFGDVATGADGTYSLTVGGVEIASQGNSVAVGSGVSAADIDTNLAGPGAIRDALDAAGITFTGSAAAGTLEFRSAGGGSIAVEEVVAGTVSGGIATAAGSANDGSSYTSTTSLRLTSADGSAITIGGTNPAAAGLTAGTGGSNLAGSFKYNSSPLKGVVIDGTNNTLEGIRDAINKAAIGVNASIINDGSGTPYRLVLNNTATGEKTSMKIRLEGDAGNPPDTALNDLLAYDPAGTTRNLKQTAAAQDTKASVNGITISSATNSISEAIQGVTLNVTKLGSSSLNISKDTGSLKTNLTNFVKAYNDLDKAIKDMTGYDPETKKAGILQGDFTAQTVQSSLRKMLGAPITGLSGSLANLGQVGISFDKTGQLSLDSGKLQKAIDNNFSDIASLFAAVGSASDSSISFVSSTNATKPGTYNINVTQIAAQGSITSDAAVAATTIADGTKWKISLNDGTPPVAKNTVEVEIPAGSYTPEQLAKQLQAAINGNSGFASNGNSVEATIDSNGKLVLASSKYGSVSNIKLVDVSGTTVGSIFGTGTTVAGKDVAGTINGLPATGSGQTLSGLGGSAVEGLKIEVTGGSTGDRGNISFSQGYAYQLNNLATSFLGSKGLIGTRTEGLNKNIKDITKQKDAFNTKLEGVEARYRAQFTRLDTVLAQMQSTQAYLTQQLASLAANA